VPVVPTVANRNQGTRELLEAAIRTAEARDPVSRHIHIDYGSDVEAALIKIEAVLAADPRLADGHYPAGWLPSSWKWTPMPFTSGTKPSEGVGHGPGGRKPAPTGKTWGRTRRIGAERRYGFLGGTVREVQKEELAKRVVLSEQVDKVLTHQLFGFPIFLFFIWLLFQMTFTLGELPMSWIEAGVGGLKSTVQALLRMVGSGIC